ESLHDGAGAEGGGFQQGAVDVLGAGGQGLTHDQAGQFVVHQHRPVTRMPVQGDQAVATDGLGGGQVGEVGVQVLIVGGGLFGVGLRDTGGDEPTEDVPDAALPGFVAVQTVDHTAVDHPAHPRDLTQFGGVHH